MNRPTLVNYHKELRSPRKLTMWDAIESATDCECPGPPPEFLLPPPPRPSILQSSDPPSSMFCNENSLTSDTCDALPLIDASFQSSPSSQTLAVIVLCSVLLGLLVFISIILVWKQKRVQNFVSCKNSPQNNCDESAARALYEDLNEVMPRHPSTYHHHYQLTGGHIVAPSLEMIDVKNKFQYPTGYPISQHPPVFLCSPPDSNPYRSDDIYNNIYEELSDPDTEVEHRGGHSEDEFAEDELSVAGDIHHRRALNMSPLPYMNNSLSLKRDINRFRRRKLPDPSSTVHHKRDRSQDRRSREFHEGMLLDALLQLYPRGDSIETSNQQRRPIPSIAQRIQFMNPSPEPYETVPVIGHLATFRPVPKPYSQDSALGSDSGYSNHTVETSSSSNRGRKDPRRISQISAHLALT